MTKIYTIGKTSTESCGHNDYVETTRISKIDMFGIDFPPCFYNRENAEEYNNSLGYKKGEVVELIIEDEQVQE